MLSVVVDCGEKAGQLLMPVVMAGELAREMAARLSQGLAVNARGALRPAPAHNRMGAGRPGVEVLADEITLADARN